MMITSKCRECGTELLNYKQAYLHSFRGGLCPICFHKLPWKDKHPRFVAEFVCHIRDGWMLANYIRKDFNIKEPWMLPLPKESEFLANLIKKEIHETENNKN